MKTITDYFIDRRKKLKLLHTSDWHLGITFNGYSAAEDQKHMLDQICRIISEKDIDAVIIAGDIFDRSIASTEAIALYDEIMTKLISELSVNVLSIAGNHDGAERISQYHRLLEESGLYLSGSLKDEFTVVEYDDAEIFLMPWFTREKAKAVFPEIEETVISTEDAFRAVCEKMSEKFTEGRKHILVAHAFVTGAETSESDRAAEVGFASAVGAQVFDAFDYVALGHIHKPQIIREKVRYSGSPMAYSFGKEESQNKGVVIIDTDDMSQEFIEIEPLHRRTTLKGTLSEIMDVDCPEETRRGYVRLEISDTFLGPETYALLVERYPLLLEARGQNINSNQAEITMTVEEFETRSKNPEEIFRAYCDEVRQECTEERLNFFKAAMEAREEE